MKAAFIDLDGVVCDSQRRFEQARQHNQGRIDWQVAFDPLLLELDELIPGVVEVLQGLEQQGWTIHYLSSRPENLRRATKNWLKKHHLLEGQERERELLLKPARQRYVATPKWKAEVVCKVASKAEKVLVIDDELENLKAIKGLWQTTKLDRTKLNCLQQGVLPVEGF